MNFNTNERKEMINIINEEFGYSKKFLRTKSNEELYDKILRNEIITKYNK
jgi:hypothetical protein